MNCPGCGKPYTPDEIEALSRWRSKAPARLTVWCDDHKHRLAKIYMADGRPVACFPPTRFQPSVIGLRRIDGTHKLADLHPSIRDVQEWLDASHESPNEVPLRCPCGVFSLGPGELMNALNYSRGRFGTPPWPWSHGNYLAQRLARHAHNETDVQ